PPAGMPDLGVRVEGPLPGLRIPLEQKGNPPAPRVGSFQDAKTPGPGVEVAERTRDVPALGGQRLEVRRAAGAGRLGVRVVQAGRRRRSGDAPPRTRTT